MRHRNAGYKLGRNTSHRRALLRNLVTSVINEDRVQTTVAKAKAVRPHIEKMITLGKKGDLHSRRQAHAFLCTDDAVKRLFDVVAPRYGDRNGGYLRIVRIGFQQGDGAEKVFIELLGAEKQLEVKRQKRDDLKAKSAPNSKSSSKNRRRMQTNPRAATRPRKLGSFLLLLAQRTSGHISFEICPLFFAARTRFSTTEAWLDSYSRQPLP